MRKWRITSDYGTFVIQRVVVAENEDEAWTHTGIRTTLEADGWRFVEPPEGEDHEIEPFDGQVLVEEPDEEE